MSNYYDKKDAKVRIAHELMNRGWNVEGYSPDESDSMTDYYCPAHWGGIATKNGFVLVVDCRYIAESKEITKLNPKGNLSFEDRDKIIKLEAMTQANGATASEEENAKKLIERIQSKILDQPAYEVIGMTTAHMGNPKGSIWHIEKDGKIYDKGNGLTKFSDMPNEWQFDINKMEYKDGYKHWGEISEEKKKVINDFKSLILRFERVVNHMNGCGDGTKETEQKAVEQQEKIGYELKTVTETKKGLKMVEVTDRKYIKVGDYIKTAHHCYYWKVIDGYMRKGTWKGVQEEKKAFTYEQVGKESRGFQSLKNAQRYYDYEFRMLKDIENGSTKIYELKEVEEAVQVEKWVKIGQTKKTYNTKTENKQETKETITEQTEKAEVLNHEITITADTDTRDNSPLWVVKLVNKVDYEEFKRIEKEIMNPIKGYYSRFKKGFIFKYDPTNILKPEQQPEQTAEEVTKEQEDQYKQSEIKDSFIYDCHFKAWDIPINEIKEAVTALNISFIDWGEKIGFKGLTAEQARQVKEISDINDSIFFIDAEKAITAHNSTTEEQPESEEVTEQPEEQEQKTVTDNIIDFKEYKNNNEVEEMETNNNSNDFNFDDIMNQFDNIEINNNSRISADDEEFCKTEQEQYNIAIKTMLNLMEEIKKSSGMDLINESWHTVKSNNKYLDSYKLREMKVIIDGMKESFISSITYHFSNKYNVTIKKERMQKNYGYDITYNNIIDDIILQLDGFTFTERAVQELKAKTRNTYNYNDYRKTCNMDIKNSKVIIDGYYAYKDTIWNEYRLKGDFGNIFTALYHFDNGTIPTDGTELHNRYCGYNNEKNIRNYDKYEPETLTKVTALKFFKNGKLEIEFKSNQFASYFAKEYLGYIEKTA